MLANFYIEDRLQKIDTDFLHFEEEMISSEDRDYIVRLCKLGKQGHLPNPHNSIILYITGLSNEFNFEKARADTVGGSPPDIDLDFDSLERERIIKWTFDHWGLDNVASIATYGTFKPRSIARDWYRVTERSKKELSTVLKMIPPPKHGKEPCMQEVLETSPDIRTYSEFVDVALKLEGMINRFGIHAAGLVISDRPLYENIPIWKNSKSDRITQFDLHEVEALGYIKFDYLGIDNLSIISSCIKLIKDRHGVEIDPWSIEDHDKKTYDLLCSGFVTGVFQMETGGTAKELIRRIQPRSISEISDVSALNRPGPLDNAFHELYIENKERGTPPEGIPEEIIDILARTHYTIIYQEQVMEICSRLGGFSLQETDDIRRAMGKKKEEVLQPYREGFLRGCSAKGLEKQQAVQLWEQLVKFAAYGFNFAHSSAYSYISYVCAWLKANYPLEFFCALMTVRSRTLQPKDWAGKAPEYVHEARQLGIEILAPSINHSSYSFTIQDNKIYMGLNAISGLGKTVTRSIVRARGKNGFKDIYDFVSRVNTTKVNLGVFQKLIKAGVFDRMGYARSDLLEHSKEIYDYVRGLVEQKERELEIAKRERERQERDRLIAKRNTLRKEAKTRDLTEAEKAFLAETKGLRRLLSLRPKTPPPKPDIPRNREVYLSLEDLIVQGEVIGCYLTEHPARIIFKDATPIDSLGLAEYVKVAGIITRVKRIKTRDGSTMAFLELTDDTGSVDVTVFPRTYTLWLERDTFPREREIVQISGKVESTHPVVRIIARKIAVNR